jgi:hypothetical protein
MRWLRAILISVVLVTSGCSGHEPAPTAKPGKGQGEGQREGQAEEPQIYAVTARGELLTTRITTDGTPGRRAQLGPRQQPQPGVAVRTHAIQASGSGRWVAWAESSVAYIGRPPAITAHGFTSSDTTVTTTAFLLDRRSGKVTEIPAAGAPLAFAGEGLVLFDPFENVYTLVTPGRPNRVLQNMPDSEDDAIGAVPEGVVAIGWEDIGDSIQQRLDLVGYDGTVRTLRRFPRRATSMAGYIQGWMSDDGTRFWIERGDHTDYCGVGPSSWLAIVTRGGALARPEIPAPPPPSGVDVRAGQGMRLQNLRPAGPGSDSAYALWASCTLGPSGSYEQVYSGIYRLNAGKWSLVRKDAIAAAAVPSGTAATGGAVVQPGRIRLGPGEGGPAVYLEPSGNALLIRNGKTTPLPIAGVDFRIVR